MVSPRAYPDKWGFCRWRCPPLGPGCQSSRDAPVPASIPRLPATRRCAQDGKGSLARITPGFVLRTPFSRRRPTLGKPVRSSPGLIQQADQICQLHAASAWRYERAGRPGSEAHIARICIHPGRHSPRKEHRRHEGARPTLPYTRDRRGRTSPLSFESATPQRAQADNWTDQIGDVKYGRSCNWLRNDANTKVEPRATPGCAQSGQLWVYAFTARAGKLRGSG